LHAQGRRHEQNTGFGEEIEKFPRYIAPDFLQYISEEPQ